MNGKYTEVGNLYAVVAGDYVRFYEGVEGTVMDKYYEITERGETTYGYVNDDGVECITYVGAHKFKIFRKFEEVVDYPYKVGDEVRIKAVTPAIRGFKAGEVVRIDLIRPAGLQTNRLAVEKLDGSNYGYTPIDNVEPVEYVDVINSLITRIAKLEGTLAQVRRVL